MRTISYWGRQGRMPPKI